MSDEYKDQLIEMLKEQHIELKEGIEKLIAGSASDRVKLAEHLLDDAAMHATTTSNLKGLNWGMGILVAGGLVRLAALIFGGV